MRNLFFIMILVVGIGLTGCAPERKWHALADTDRFTDTSIKMVTIGDLESWVNAGWLTTSTLNYYPFIGLRNGEIIFGIRSGGRFRIPVGAVQVRIDGNRTWDISPEETPIYLMPGQANLNMPVIPNGSDMAAFQQGITEVMAKSMSPFTAATGDKAKAIIKEMFAGKRMIYRSVGYNQAGSTEGEIPIDESFFNAMKQIGITEEMLN